ncbi:MAG: tetratricopeptide repeat protein [Treponema sp.]|nr:tetratricopeptide repeat protein [Treponema sp.]MCL2251515.1 tetratricopeptide repeat protein [Treponema sp.]
MQNEKNTQDNFMDKLNDFIQRNRKKIFAVLGIFIILFVASIVFLAVKDSSEKKSIVQLEELTKKYDSLFSFFKEENSEVDLLITDLKNFAGNKKGIAPSKAWALIAEIYVNREDWSKAEEAFIKSAGTGAKTYLGPISLFNAAAAAEEQGKLESALSLLKECLSHNFEFPSAPRAQFSIGRINEQLGNTSDAIEAYRAVMINWPDMPVWQQLARSRILVLEIN